MAELIYPKESYSLVACAYAVFNRLKYGYHEKYYQRAYAVELKKAGYKFDRELRADIVYDGQKIGKYFVDFLVEGKIIVEIKVGNDFHTNYLKQVLSYLKVTKKRLGIIILFTPKGVRFKRLVN